MQRLTHLRPGRSAAAFAAVALVLAACGGDDDADADDPGTVQLAGVSASGADLATETDAAGGGDGELAVADAGAAGDANGSGAVSDEELALEFAQCMRDEGIDFPDPVTNADGSIEFFGGPGGGGGQGGGGQGAGGFDEATRDAFAVCGEIIEGASFLPGGGDGFDDPATQDAFLEFAQCLRDQGLDVDDPDLGAFQPGDGGGGGAGALFGDGFDPNDPATTEAIQACQSIFTNVFGG